MEGKSTPETEPNIHACPECGVDFETTERFREHFFDEHLVTTPADTSVAEGSSPAASQPSEPDDSGPGDFEPDDLQPDALEPDAPEPDALEPEDSGPGDSSPVDNDDVSTADSSPVQQPNSAAASMVEPSLSATPTGATPIRSHDDQDVKLTLYGSESLENQQSLARTPSPESGRTSPLGAIRETGRSVRRGHLADILLALMALILAAIVGSVLLVVILELVR